MEISAKILREVEFRDRLRGYDTDEVDEFLERVAVGIEELLGQINEATERAVRAERQVEELPTSDDDSIRRTLVLAQRTADLAVKEAKADAERLLEEARSEAEALLSAAHEHAERTRSDAEEDLQRRVERLSADRVRLQQEVADLVTLVDAERGRLATSLEGLLGHLSGLDPNPQVREVAAHVPAHTPSPPPPVADSLFEETEEDPLELDEDLNLDFALPDVERQVAEDAERAVAPSSFTEQPIEELDPDEELWDRWARSGGTEDTASDDTLGLGRPNSDNWPA